MSVPSDFWIQTFGGNVYDYSSKTKSDKITIKMISHPLARMYRFLCHSKARWSVAEHSILVRDIGFALLSDPSEKCIADPYLLLHDAHEAFVGDMPAPLKKYLKHYHNFNFKTLEQDADIRIRFDLGLETSPPTWVQELIREADLYALKLERESFMASKHEWVIDDVAIPNVVQKVAFYNIGHTGTIDRVFRKNLETAIKDFARA